MVEEKVCSDIKTYKWVRTATSTDIRKKIANLRDMREAAGIKQGDVAKILGVFQSNVSALENGKGPIFIKFTSRYITVMQKILNNNI